MHTIVCDYCQEELNLNAQVIKMQYHFHTYCLDKIENDQRLNKIYFSDLSDFYPYSHIKSDNRTYVTFWAFNQDNGPIGMDGGLSHVWVEPIPTNWELARF